MMAGDTMRGIYSLRNLLLALILSAVPATSFAGVFISVNIAPPVLPVYVQPACPGDGYIWTPGYWAYGDDGYYWVPGTWVLAPYTGALWTPGYWGWGDGFYAWHPGYWGPHIGYYGGINYGFGYFGVGYLGGGWYGDRFRYNTAVTNVNITNVHNVYVNKTVINNTTIINNNNRVSYNGPGGARAVPSHAEIMAAREQHLPATAEQTAHMRAASLDRSQLAAVNHGRPAALATVRPAASLRTADNPGATFNPGGNNRANISNRVQSNAAINGGNNRTSPGGDAARPLITARPAAPNTTLRGNSNYPGSSQGQLNPGSRVNSAPAYPGNVSRGTGPQPHYNAAPQAHYDPAPQPRYNPAPQPRYNPAPQQRYDAAPRYNPPPQQRYSAPEPRYNPAPQQRFSQAPQQHYAPPAQPHYSAPQQQHYSAPQAFHGGGGGEGRFHR